MAVPQIPPRPTRSQLQQSSTAANMEAPKVPPRPSHRLVERSVSPRRDSFARSPLNEAPFQMSHGSMSSSLYSSNSQNTSNSSLGLSHRPPSVSLPSIGQEGDEYGNLEYDPAENNADQAGHDSSTQTRNVGSDLPLHAPKPSFSTSTAKARVATVTRTDSSQAAAVGIGKASTPTQSDDKDSHAPSLQPKASFTRTESSTSTERPASALAESEQGIPEIGQRVPMYPNAGDVQAPSPSPFSQNLSTGIGFHNDATQKAERHHGRTRSGREVIHGPPGSYGLHGHGVPNQDRFEKAWYDKHPEALVREGTGQYGPGIGGGRGEWALSSEDLNKIVRETASRGSGFGTSPNIVGLPNEQIGYIASEEYASRMNSPRPQSAAYHKKAHSNHSQTHVESPLRKASFPVDVKWKVDFDQSKDSHPAGRLQSETALESETEDDDVVHVDPPDVRRNKYHGNGYDPPTEDLGPHGGNTDAEGGWIDETGYGTPILASDEVAKTPGLEYLQPAVSPAQERRGSAYYAGVDSDIALSYQSGHRNGSRSGSVSGSRSSSRPGSIHGSLPNLTRFTSLTSHDDREDMHTPLEDVDEYEPLFPDEEGKDGRAMSIADRFKQRPDMKRRFPSQDIWEDTPSSLQLQATVSTPEPAEQQTPSIPTAPAAVFESPETEAARKGEVSEDDKAKLIPKEERWAQSRFQPHLREDMGRPGMKQRFPSRDIWEDTPDSARLETTVGGPQGEGLTSPLDEGLIAGAVVHTTGRPGKQDISGEQPRDGATAGAAAVEKPTIPSIPPRPVRNKPVEESTQSKAPTVPARPLQKMRQDPTADTPSSPSKSSSGLSPTEGKETSPIEGRKAPLLPDRPKPHVPARPPKPVTRDSSESTTLSNTTSTTSVGSSNDSATSAKGITSPPPSTKPKPALPSRPVGSKIASLKAGFMSDLDKRLQLGPQGPPRPHEKPATPEMEEDKAPLVDARKGRARGPARRKPAASPAAADEDVMSKAGAGKFAIAEPWTLWQISTAGDGALDAVHAADTNPDITNTDSAVKTAGAPTSTFATNTTGASIDEHDKTVAQPDGADPSHAAEDDLSVEEDTRATTAEPDPNPIEARPEDEQESMDAPDSPTINDKALPTDLEQAKSTPQSSTETADATAQTGEKVINFDTESGKSTKVTAYEDAMANKEGDMVVQEEMKAAPDTATATDT